MQLFFLCAADFKHWRIWSEVKGLLFIDALLVPGELDVYTVSSRNSDWMMQRIRDVFEDTKFAKEKVEYQESRSRQF